MHNKMAEKVMRSNILFFDSNPIGRITTRFTKDLSISDNFIPGIGVFVAMFLFRICVTFITILVVNPWLIIILVFCLAIISQFAMLAIGPMIECQKFEQMYFAPINTTLNMMVSGISTLRGYNKFDFFKIKFDDAIEKSANATFGFIVVSRWLSVRMDLTIVNLAFVTAVLAFVLKDTLSKELLVMSLQIVNECITYFALTIRFIAELQNAMACPQRILGYIKLESEDDLVKTHDKELIDK